MRFAKKKYSHKKKTEPLPHRKEIRSPFEYLFKRILLQEGCMGVFVRVAAYKSGKLGERRIDAQ